MPAKRTLRVELEHGLGEAIVIGALAHTADWVAENLTGFLDRNGDAIGAERAPKPEQVAQQKVGPVEAAQEAGRRDRLAICLGIDWDRQRRWRCERGASGQAAD